MQTCRFGKNPAESPDFLLCRRIFIASAAGRLKKASETVIIDRVFEERIINHKYIVVEKRILYADKDN
jgi:chorismate mutase